MTTAATAAFVVAAVAAGGDWVARARRARALEYACKPAALAALVVAAVVLVPAHDAGARRALFVAALACSLVGDVLLMVPGDRFTAGLAAFLVAHGAYSAGLWAQGLSVPAVALAAVVVALALAPVARRVLGSLSDRPGLRVPVGLYMAVISVMLATAVASGNGPAAAGAALFVGSDGLLAWNRFVRPLRGADVAVMVTYHLGQAGLVVSLLH